MQVPNGSYDLQIFFPIHWLFLNCILKIVQEAQKQSIKSEENDVG